MTDAAMEPLVGTVKHHVRHLVVLTPAADWPAQLAAGTDLAAGLLRELERLEASGQALFPIKVTAATNGSADPAAASNDVLVFPEMVRHRGVRSEHATALVARYAGLDAASVAAPAVGLAPTVGQPPTVGPLPAAEVLPGKHLLVCVHRGHDERCGDSGPPLLDALDQQLTAQGVEDVTLYGSSHVGGHRFAGCLLAFPSGDWYGRVSPSQAAAVISECVLAERILTSHWRGRLGLTPEAQTAAQV